MRPIEIFLRFSCQTPVMDVATGKVTYGVGVSPNITRASHRALFSGLNRLFK